MTPLTAGSDVERAVLDGVPRGSLVGADWLDAGAGRIPVEDPSTNAVLCEVADAGVEEALAAVEAAATAQRHWAGVPARERAELLRRAFEAMIGRRDELALLITLEMGKPLHEAQAEVTYAAEFVRWFSEEAGRVAGRFGDNPEGTAKIATSRQPVGPCLLITPWNFPLAMATRKVAPAVAAGCTMVLKPAAQTPLAALAFGQIMLDAGLPPGVLNIVATSRAAEVTRAMVADGRLRKLSFTGSTEVGRLLLREAADGVMRTSMELGGNAPLIVFDDADLERALDAALVAKLRNSGQSCTAANRVYVQRGIASAFIPEFTARMASMKLGRGTEDVDVGPLIDDAARTKLAELVDDAVRQGARILTGGRALDGSGYFYEPTVLDRVHPLSRLLTEEIFGPVAPIITFDDDREAVRAANDTHYGLVAYIITQDVDRAFRVADELETGMVGINQGVVSNAAAPFGGIKHSGLGREGGHEGIDEYLATKYIAVASPAPKLAGEHGLRRK